MLDIYELKQHTTDEAIQLNFYLKSEVPLVKRGYYHNYVAVHTACCYELAYYIGINVDNLKVELVDTEEEAHAVIEVKQVNGGGFYDKKFYPESLQKLYKAVLLVGEYCEFEFRNNPYNFIQ